MRKPVDITNHKYGRLTAIQWNGLIQTGVNKKSTWLCLCECGKSLVVLYQNLVRGTSKSCGCLMKEVSSQSCVERNTTHGLSSEFKKEYHTWKGLKQRCLNPNNRKYPDYGGRGIKVCDRWLNSFENFLSDMNKKPSQYHSLDRINNDGNYEPSNCRWADSLQQANNRRQRIYGKRSNKQSIRASS